ncbi:MAG: ATPase [Streptosporangiales bacterium]
MTDDVLARDRIERDIADLAVVHDGAHGEFRIRTVRTDPPRYVSFRWELDASGESTPMHTLVEFFIDERPGGATLRVVESGFAGLDLPAEERRVRFEDNTSGWETELAAARTHLERR